MDKPTTHVSSMMIPYEDQVMIDHFAEYACNHLVDQITKEIGNIISTKGEYSFRMHEALVTKNEPLSAAEFKIYLDVRKIVRCKNCIYRRNEGGGFCIKHPDCGDDDDWFCGDGKEKE